MKKRVFSIMGLSFLLAAFALAVVPAQAQNVDDKIKALEQELLQLKSDQMELKKEATAAAAALPSFEYRGGNGLNIEAADKSWAFRAQFEGHMRMLFESGRDHVGRTNGEVMGRRFRPGFYYCINNCLYEIEALLDFDGFGTGSGKNNTGTTFTSILQRGAFHFHAENLSPYLPTVTVGMDISTSSAASLSRQGSGATGAQQEYDIFSRRAGPNTGNATQGITLTWDDKSLTGIGIPGRIGRFQFGMATVGDKEDGQSSFTDRKDFTVYGNIYPFSESKNKWINGLLFETGAWFCNVDKRAFDTAAGAQGRVGNGCDEPDLRDHGDGGAQVLHTNGPIGSGLFHFIQSGITWRVGPYSLRAVIGFNGADDGGAGQGGTDTTGKKRGSMFLLGHDLFIWSPQGFLTGSPTTVGSILIGTHFERNNQSCESASRCGAGDAGGINGGQFHRTRVLLREWDLWYFMAPRMSVGMGVLWYDSSNLRAGRTRAGQNLGVHPVGCPTSVCSGKGGDWTDVMLNWRYSF
jgi:hypothetical protein